MSCILSQMKSLIIPWILVLILANFGESALKCGGDGCCDRNDFCNVWSLRGECEKNINFMANICRASCNLCPNSLIADKESVEDSANVSGCNKVQTIEVAKRRVFTINQHAAKVVQTQCGESNNANPCQENLCFHKQFRTLDGTCNNLKNSLNGAGFTAFVRILQPLYEDGVGRYAGKESLFRPNARELTRQIISTPVRILSNSNQMVMQFGQFFSHDVSNRNFQNFCQCNDNHENCMNIPYVLSDPRQRVKKCESITRDIPNCGTGNKGVPRESMNRASSYIDGTMVYGPTQIDSMNLRARQFMKTNIVNGRHFPPFSISSSSSDSMTTGDSRSTLFIGLASLHTLFVRLHNKIATELQTTNRKWNDERTYQETRKIVGSIIQVVTYNEFIPALLGANNARTLIPEYHGYKDNVDASISLEFGGAAFRLHGMISDSYPLLNDRYQSVSNLRFIQGMNQIKNIISSGTDALIRGIISQPLRKPQRVTPQVSEEMFGGSVDLATINIQRGRDIGLRTYNDYRKLCKLSPIVNFMDWDEVSDPMVKQKMADMYKEPENIDLYVGGMVEEPLIGSLVGPTFACIIAEQFKRSRDGDRFFYKNSETFKPEQTEALDKITMATIICLTGENYKEITPNAFQVDRGETAIPCSDIPQLNLTAWRSV
uniref:ShKT domain-containing protein n=1 Tax=Rhabditophanes sp. KR3021 TaxID=114890 RepID=A0AC35U3Z6_9BILA